MFATLFAAAALAATAPATTLRHADLDLATADGAQVMLTRIKAAAARVCLDSPGTMGADAASIERFETCHRQSVARAVTALAAPRVTRAYAAKAPGQVLARLP